MAYVPGKNNTREFQSEFKLREQMCTIGRRIWLKGFCAGNEGNHSVRLGADRVLCTPSLMSKGELKPEDMCIVDMDGNQVAGKRKRTSEILLHLTIYKNRDDVRAVVHSHPPHATAFAVADVELPTCIHPEAELFLGPVKTARYVSPGDTRLGESILPFVKDSNAILLGNHGVVCHGADLEDAYYKLEIVDAYARILLLAKQLGSVKTLSGSEMAELIAIKDRFGLKDPRTGEAKSGSVACASSDFLSRVGEFGSRGKMAFADGSTCSPIGGSPLEKAINKLAPATISEAQLEELVQTITDQIMAARRES